MPGLAHGIGRIFELLYEMQVTGSRENLAVDLGVTLKLLDGDFRGSVPESQPHHTELPPAQFLDLLDGSGVNLQLVDHGVRDAVHWWEVQL